MLYRMVSCTSGKGRRKGTHLAHPSGRHNQNIRSYRKKELVSFGVLALKTALAHTIDRRLEYLLLLSLVFAIPEH
jgi:hypothetical protein